MPTLLGVKVTGLAGRPITIEFDLKPSINIFFGLNGSGKTSLLKILHSALYNDPSLLANVAFERAEVTFYALNEDVQITRSISRIESPSTSASERARQNLAKEGRTLVREGRTLYTVAEYEAAVERESRLEGWITEPPLGSKSTGRFTHRYLSTTRMLDTAATEAPSYRPGPTEADLDRAFVQEIQRIWRSYVNRTLSEVRTIQSNGIAEILRSVLFPHSREADRSPLEIERAYQSAKQFLARQPRQRSAGGRREFEMRYRQDPQFRSIVQDVDEIERRMEQAEEPRRKLVELVSAFFAEGKIIRFDDQAIRAEVGGLEIPLLSLSSGEKQLVRLLVEAIMVGPNPILIDEPELSLHIDWQRALVRSMRTVNSEAQILMATHSPEIMEEVDDDCIFRL
jgi:energy-coupling factor transporter ATP-binding protein EcfA2